MTSVQHWLESLDLGQYSAAFAENAIEWEHLPDLNHEVLQTIGVKAAGHRMTILKAAANLDVATTASPSEQPEGPPQAAQPAPSVDAERRQLTVMFCDLVGSTMLSTQMDPEDLRDVITSFQNSCRAVIQRYDGFIARYMGDGILVYFGYPQAHEDDAMRAVRAGLEIVGSMPTLNSEVGTIHSCVLAVRVGVATGPVVVGDIIGEGAAQEAAVVGETPNLAARLQGEASPDQLVISPSVHRLVGDTFVLEALGARDLKGISEPVPLWRVCGERDPLTQFQAQHRSGGQPMVGRQEELGLALRAWEAARQGHGQVVLIQGEAGIGKSRLLKAVWERLAGEDYLWEEIHCSPYHSNSSLYPLIDHLKRALSWNLGDRDDERLAKLEEVLGAQSLPLAEVIPLYADLLSLPLPEGRYPPLALNPRRRRDATLDAVLGFSLEQAEEKPVVQVWEDLHWADPTTLELLGLCIEQSPTVAMLLILTYRPEFVPPWPMRSHVVPIVLNRMERPEVETLIELQACGKIVPTAVVEHVVTKADGVPLYAEELTKTILDSDYLQEEADRYIIQGTVSQLPIPATLQDSLMARLDRVPEAHDVVQMAAVVGREFSYEMLQSLVPLEEAQLRDALDRLVEDELLYQRGRPPRSRYIFKHALIHDAAYQSLLRRVRQQYHRKVAELLEERFPQTVEGHPELLARHYTEAGDSRRGVALWQLAGERARAQFANWEAIAHLSQGLAVLESLPEDEERRRKELALQLALGHASSVARGKGAPEVEMAYERAQTLCRQLGDTRDLLPPLFGLWRFDLVSRPLQHASDLAAQLMRLAEERPDPPNFVIAHYATAVTQLMMGDLAQGEKHFEQVATRYAPEQRKADVYQAAQDPGTAGLVFSSIGEWLLGYPDQARTRLRASVGRAQELEDAVSLTHALCFSSVVMDMCADDAETRAMAENAIALATEKGFAAWTAFGRVMKSWVACKSGLPGGSLEELRHSITLRRDLGMELMVPFFMTLLAQGCQQAGQVEEGLDVLGCAQEVAQERSEHWWEAEIHRLRGELLLAASSDNVEQGADSFERALEIARTQASRSLELKAAMSLARLWQLQGKRIDATNLLAPIYGWFSEGFDTQDLQHAKTLLEM